MSEDSVNTYKKYLAEPWFTLIKLGLKISKQSQQDFWVKLNQVIKCYLQMVIWDLHVALR